MANKKKQEVAPTPPELVVRQPLITDGTYWTKRRIDGYQRPINIIIGPREPGKSTSLMSAMWKECCKGLTGGYITRNKNKINETLVNAIRSPIQKFYSVPPLHLQGGGEGTGNANILCNGWPVIRAIALGMSTDDIKRTVIPDVSFLLFDEAILDLNKGDRYLPGEADKFKELYTTLVREKPNLKVYMLGNVYSMYNPYFLDFGIDGSKIKPGEIFCTDKVAVERITVSEKLKTKLEESNPYYYMDEKYRSFALEGEAKNDSSIELVRVRPRNATTKFVLRLLGKDLAVCRLSDSLLSNQDGEPVFWVGYSKTEKKTAIAYDVKELVTGTRLANPNDKFLTGYFRTCFEQRRVVYQDLACYYLIEEIYKSL